MGSHGHNKMQYSGAYSNIHNKKTFSKQTNTPPEFMECPKCKQRDAALPTGNIIGDCCDSNVIADYVKAINYINSCHSIINEISKNSNGNTPSVNMPEMPNFLAIFKTLSNNKGPIGDKMGALNGKEASSQPGARNFLKPTQQKVTKRETGKKPQTPVDPTHESDQNNLIEFVPEIKKSQGFLQDSQTTDSDNEYEILHKISYKSYQNKAILQKKVPDGKEIIKCIKSNEQMVCDKTQKNTGIPKKTINSKKEIKTTHSRIPSLTNQRKKTPRDISPDKNADNQEMDHDMLGNAQRNISQQELNQYAREVLQTDGSEESSPRSNSSEKDRPCSPRNVKKPINRRSLSASPSPPKSRSTTPRRKAEENIHLISKDSLLNRKKIDHDLMSLQITNSATSNHPQMEAQKNALNAYLQDNDNCSDINPVPHNQMEVKYFRCSPDFNGKSPKSWQGCQPIEVPHQDILTNHMNSAGKKSNQSHRRSVSPSKLRFRSISRSPSPKRMEKKGFDSANSAKFNVDHERRGQKVLNSTGSIILSDSDPIFSDSDIDEDFFQNHANQQSHEPYKRSAREVTEILNNSVDTISRAEFINFKPPSPKMKEQILKASRSRVNIKKNVFRQPRQDIASDDEDDKIIKFSTQGEPTVYTIRSYCSYKET